MFARVSALLLVVPFLVAATAVPRGETGGCNTGPIQCCNQIQNTSDPEVASLMGLLGLVLPKITGQVGLTCNPISIIGIGGNNCAAQPVCCTKNDFNGLINFGCSPVNVNL